MMSPVGVSILRRTPKMSGERRSRNPEKLGGAALITIGLFVNKADVTTHRAGKSEVDFPVEVITTIWRRRGRQMLF